MIKKLFVLLIGLNSLIFANLDLVYTYNTPSEKGDLSNQTQEEHGLENYYPSTDKLLGFVGLEFLYWKAIEGASDWAVKGQKGLPEQNVGQLGEFHTAKFNWDPGYRLKIGVQFPPHFWELLGDYTYYHTSRHQKVDTPDLSLITASTGPSLIGTFPQFTDSGVIVAHMNTHLNYNGANLTLGKVFLISKSMLFRPYIGVTGAWMKEEWRFKYIGTSIATNKQKWKFHGGGMRIGFDLDWLIGLGFSLDSKFSIASILGSYHQKSYSYTNNTGPDETGIPDLVQDARLHDNRIATNLQFFLGPSYNRNFSSCGFKIFLGYELNTWFNLHETIQPVNFSPRSIDNRYTNLKRGVLAFHGLTSGLTLSF